MSNKKSQGPLLYIYQPFTRTPLNNMQDVYISKGEADFVKEENEKDQKHKSQKKKETNTEVVIEEVKSESKLEADTSQQTRFQFNRVKPFKEMDLQERLNYLINFPKVLPPVPCVFYTTDENFQGYLTDNDGEQVTIQFHDQTFKTIPIRDLKNVMMIGIKNNK